MRGPASRIFVAAVALSLVSAVVRPASADAPNAAAAADSLFREGRTAAARGDWDSAAKRFAESQRLSPAPGTLLNLALAEEHLGRALAAWEHARALLDQLPPADDRRAIAQALFERLDKRVPRLTLDGELPVGARVELDGLGLEASSLGVALPVDVGRHSVRVVAPSRRDRSFERTLTEGERATVSVTVGDPLPAPSPPGTPPREAPHERRGFPRAIGYVALAASGAALAGTAVTGLLAVQRNRDVEAHCDDTGCDATGVDAARSGRTFATAATVLGVVTGAALATGITILVLVPKDRGSEAAAFVGVTHRF